MLRSLLTVHPLTIETHQTGLALAERYGLSTQDAMIAASALHAGCETLCTLSIRPCLALTGKRCLNSRRGRSREREMNWRKGLAAACVLAAGLAGAVQAKDYKTIVIATEGAYPPYNMHAPNGQLIGFEIDLGNDLCRRMQVHCTWIAQDWDSMVPALNAGKFDAIMDGMSITPQRLKALDFSEPYTQSPTTFLVLKNGPLAKLPDTGRRVSLDDEAATAKAIATITPMLKGKTVGVQVATIQDNLLNTYLKKVVTIRTYKTTEEHDLDLAADRIDAALASTSYFISTLSKPGGDRFVEVGPLFTGGLLGKGTGVGIRKSDPKLVAMFNKAIDAAKKDGTVRKLSIKWFKSDISPQS